jgi:hypothetical protein
LGAVVKKIRTILNLRCDVEAPRLPAFSNWLCGVYGLTSGAERRRNSSGAGAEPVFITKM